MGFMANFWGSAAVAGDQTQRDWRAIWLEEEKLEEQKEQNQRDVEYRNADMSLRREAAQESARQFDLNYELANARQLIDEERFDWDVATGMVETIRPEFSSATAPQRVQMLNTISDSLGGMDNPYASMFIDGLTATAPISELTNAEARQILSDWMNPTTGQMGTFYRTPDSYVQLALDSLKTNGDPSYDLWAAEVEAAREQIEADVNWRSGLERDFMQGTADAVGLENEATRAGTLYTQAMTKTENESRSHIVRGLEVDVKRSLAELGAQNITNATLEEYIGLQMGQMEAAIRSSDASTMSTEQQTEFFDSTSDILVKTMMQELTNLGLQGSIAESDLRVMVATEKFRVDLERLRPEQLEASIQAELANTDLTNAQRLNLTTGMVADLMATGNVPLLESMGEAMLRPVFGDGWELARDNAVAFAGDRRNETEAREAAEMALLSSQNSLTLANAAQTVEATRFIGPAHELEASRVNLGWANLDHQKALRQDALNAAANAAAYAELGIMSPEDAASAMKFADGIDHFNVQLARISTTESELEWVSNILASDDISAGDIATVEDIMGRYGISAPPSTTGMFNVVGARDAVALAVESVESDMSLLQSQYAMYSSLIGQNAPEGVASMSSMDLLDPRVQALVEGAQRLTPAGTAIRIDDALRTEEYDTIEPNFNLWVSRNHGLGRSIAPGDGERLLEMFLNDWELNGHLLDRGQVRDALSSVGITGMEIENLMVESYNAHQDYAETVYSYDELLFPYTANLRSSGGFNTAEDVARYIGVLADHGTAIDRFERDALAAGDNVSSVLAAGEALGFSTYDLIEAGVLRGLLGWELEGDDAINEALASGQMSVSAEGIANMVRREEARLQSAQEMTNIINSVYAPQGGN